ncbi:LamG domain-containing protein [Streptomyces bathyalis]|uniref:LamG domain-containing protein n=1 Tax=Streptomyces bathyalis TaxID=2710756 RepID=A0A7T1T558_9ACTN|nr:LamG domain-containing protein [Streptomyces bathyalis]QPP06588.1 LamG domain-containing protein [Streptomyces bathyalis]
MVFTRLSDDELRRLAQDEGERTPGARDELEKRHYQAVRAFAFVVSPSAGDELAGEAWEQALRPLDEDITGAMRPRALASVLRTGADWLGAGRRDALAPELVNWFEDPVGDGEADVEADGAAAAARLADLRASSLTAQAFERLPARSQTVLWHHEVEHDDAAAVHQLLATGAEDVFLLNRRARRELYTTYVTLHQNETVDDACRRLHRMLLAYAEQTSMNTPGDLVAHLDRCEHCARAVDDLERMRFEFGSVLAEALLPWGGADYALAAHTVSSATLDVVPGASAPDRRTGAGARAWASAAGPGRRFLDILRARVSVLPGIAALKGKERSSRARRFALTAALVGLCSLVVAVAYTGGLRQGAENGAQPRPGNTSRAPAPPGGSEPTATATSTVTATKPPGNRGNGYQPSSPVRGAALEWLFDSVDDGVVADTSGNGIEGTFDGDPLPEAVKGGIEFAGQQSVVADGPVVDTSKSFTVSARAKMNDTEDFQTVISQDATNISGFSVQYDPDSDRWEMIVPEEDEEDSDLVQAGSGPGPEPDRWTYLAGVYDAGAREIRLYVDGHLEDSAAVGGGADAAGDYSTTTTTTSTTTSGGGFGFDGSGNSNGAGNGDEFSGGGGGFGGSGGYGGAGGGYFGGASQEAGGSAADLAGGELADEIFRRATGRFYEVVDAEGDFAVGRGLAGEEFVRGFDGTIDDVRAFKRALTAGEVAALAGR